MTIAKCTRLSSWTFRSTALLSQNFRLRRFPDCWRPSDAFPDCFPEGPPHPPVGPATLDKSSEPANNPEFSPMLQTARELQELRFLIPWRVREL